MFARLYNIVSRLNMSKPPVRLFSVPRSSCNSVNVLRMRTSHKKVFYRFHPVCTEYPVPLFVHSLIIEDPISTLIQRVLKTENESHFRLHFTFIWHCWFCTIELANCFLIFFTSSDIETAVSSHQPYTIIPFNESLVLFNYNYTQARRKYFWLLFFRSFNSLETSSHLLISK